MGKLGISDMLFEGLDMESRLMLERQMFKGIDTKQLAMGIKVEMEHTKNPKVARKIALDHLKEMPDYYTRLSKMESQGKKDKGEINKAIEEIDNVIVNLQKSISVETASVKESEKKHEEARKNSNEIAKQLSKRLTDIKVIVEDKMKKKIRFGECAKIMAKIEELRQELQNGTGSIRWNSTRPMAEVSEGNVEIMKSIDDMDECIENLKKAIASGQKGFPSMGGGTGAERPGHKYIRREGQPGNWVYFYKDAQGKEHEGPAPKAEVKYEGSKIGGNTYNHTAEIHKNPDETYNLHIQPKGHDRSFIWSSHKTLDDAKNFATYKLGFHEQTIEKPAEQSAEKPAEAKPKSKKEESNPFRLYDNTPKRKEQTESVTTHAKEMIKNGESLQRVTDYVDSEGSGVGGGDTDSRDAVAEYFKKYHKSKPEGKMDTIKKEIGVKKPTSPESKPKEKENIPITRGKVRLNTDQNNEFNWNRKPEAFTDVPKTDMGGVLNKTKELIEKSPIYEVSEFPKENPNDHFTGIYRLKHGKDTYLVDPQGYSYPRYMSKITEQEGK